MFLACLLLNLIFLSSLVIIPCVGQDQFTITRSTAGSQKDLFIVPRCSSSSLKCSALYSGASNHDPTQCKCSCRYEYSTFGHYNGKWVCLGNSQVRKQPGCQFLFDGEANYKPLKVLSSGSAYQLILPSFSCTIDQSASIYRKCDGTWAAINAQSTIFSFWPLTENLGRGRYRYTMKVGTATSLAGTIVSLKVKCRSPSRSSCVLLKIAGQINCPVNIVRSSTTQTPTVNATYPPATPPFSSEASTRNSSTEAPGPDEGSSNSGKNGGSSETVAAVVIIIILIVIVAAIVGFVIWKKRRGENVLLIDHLISIARKFRSPPPTKKPEEPLEERIYAEIPDHPAPRQTAKTPSAPHYAEIYSVAYQDPNEAFAPPNQQNITTSPKVPDEEGPTDERGYMVPVDSPSHNSVQDKNRQNTASYGKNKNPKAYDKRQGQSSTQGGGVGSNDVAPYYDVLEIHDKQKTENNGEQTSGYKRHLNSPDRGRAGRSNVSPSVVPGTEGAAGSNIYVTKQRRRPPSPPRKI